MRTTYDLLDHVYTALNVVGVTGTINGAIWRRAVPVNRNTQDIQLVTLPIKGDENVQEGTVIVNIWCPNLEGGYPNETKLKQIAVAVIAALEAYAASEYFSITIVSENTMQDPERVRMSYTSIRINVYIET